MVSRRAQRRRRPVEHLIVIREVPGDAPNCFEVTCEPCSFWAHTASGYEAAEFVALRHSLSAGQVLNRKDIRS